MLKFSTQGNIKKWIVEAKFIRDFGIRSPQGFTFEISSVPGLGNYFWTTNEFAAYLFYIRHGLADDDVVDYFQPRKKHEEYLYDLSYSVKSDKSFPSPEGMQYRAHQNAGIEYCQLAGNVLVADYQRTGKTALVLGYINSANFQKILILCPKTAKMVWQSEGKKWLLGERKLQVLTSRDALDPSADIYVVNYDLLHMKPELADIQFDLIVADEVHKCKSPVARRTKFFFSLQGKQKLGLSGTPLVNTPKDWLTVLKWINPFWEEFYIYKDKFASKNGLLLTLEEAQRIARSFCMLRRLQDQIFDGEPIERRLVPLEVPHAIKDIAEKSPTCLEDYGKLRRVLGLAKVPAILNHIDVYSSDGEKLIVFAYHREVIERLRASLGSRAVTVYGGITDAQRKAAVDRFNTDPECTVFLGSIGAAGEAINLSVSRHIIFAEQDFSNGQMEQAEERCSDKDQQFQVLIEYLVFSNSIDHRMMDKIHFKNVRADKGMDMLW